MLERDRGGKADWRCLPMDMYKYVYVYEYRLVWYVSFVFVCVVSNFMIGGTADLKRKGKNRGTTCQLYVLCSVSCYL